jgi:uridylate kinase
LPRLFEVIIVRNVVVAKFSTRALAADRGSTLELRPVTEFAAAVHRLESEGGRVVVVGGGTAAHVFLDSARVFAASELVTHSIGAHIVMANTLVLWSALRQAGCDVAPVIASDVHEIELGIQRNAVVVVGPLPTALSTDSVAALAAEHCHARLLIFLKKGRIYDGDPSRAVPEVSAERLCAIAAEGPQLAGKTPPIDVYAARIIARSRIATVFMLYSDAKLLDAVAGGRAIAAATHVAFDDAHAATSPYGTSV